MQKDENTGHRPDEAPAPRRVVVLQVLPAMGTGGVERGTVEIADALVQAGWEALVASSGGQREAALIRVGARHITLPLAVKSPWGIYANAKRLAQLIRDEKVDIVHARSRAPAWAAYLACKWTGARFVTTYHGVYNENIPFKRRYNAVMAKGERVIAVSRYVAGIVRARHRVDLDRMRVIHRGVDTDIFSPAAVPYGRIERFARAWNLMDGQTTIMLPGRLTRWKGQAVLIEALARLGRPDLRCLLVGDDQGRQGYRDELEKLARRRNVSVTFTGQVDDMPAALMLADVVVHASTDAEAFGRVVIEAQAMERPVIASDLGGPGETVETGVTGWRVYPGDPQALTETLRYVLSLTTEQRTQLGAQSRNAVLEHYTTARMQAATLDVYRELLDQPAA